VQDLFQRIFTFNPSMASSKLQKRKRTSILSVPRAKKEFSSVYPQAHHWQQLQETVRIETGGKISHSTMTRVTVSFSRCLFPCLVSFNSRLTWVSRSYRDTEQEMHLFSITQRHERVRDARIYCAGVCFRRSVKRNSAIIYFARKYCFGHSISAFNRRATARGQYGF